MTPVPSKESYGPERFARLRAIFEAALERPARERHAYIEGACVGDKAMEGDVLDMLETEGVTSPMLDRRAPVPSSGPEEGRFPAGTVLAGRYRILGLLGSGGMGEVYRARDQVLTQTLALKFIAPRHISDAALVRFRNEVRIARQVSHPNVCRVYDLGMVEGQHFLSMEYIDGEDLASLLRRIGRLPQDKAIEFTRKICAGLAAAHDRGVLHRDLKPANIMIDGRGQPRITDFGLAGLAQEIPLSDLRSGTPAYMSPEQKAGREVTIRSDIYSLGLVLHEMFTGKSRRETESTPSELVKDLDPAVERLILRCLEEAPKRRPQSAFSVAMALPGGDPIAVALAAGETPSPEMVAASQELEGFSLRTALICVALVVLSAVVISRHEFFGRLVRTARFELPPEALAYRAQELVRALGYVDPPADSVYGISCCDPTNLRLANARPPAERDAILASHRPPIARFWYRQHSGWLKEVSGVSRGVSTRFPGVSFNLPSNAEPGMLRLMLDPAGHLLALEVQSVNASAADATAAQPDWRALFVAAGLDIDRFAATAPTQLPRVPFDAQMAWLAPTTTNGMDPVRVEAAAWHGRVVFFSVDREFSTAASADVTTLGRPTILPIFFPVLMGVSVVAAILAINNVRAGRGDRKGALRLASVIAVASLAVWLMTAHHVPDVWEWVMLLNEIGRVGIIAGLVAIGYLAVEPYARHYWPESLISWNRVQVGRINDTLVASHALVGVTTFMVYELLAAIVWRQQPIAAFPEEIDPLQSINHFLAFLFNIPAIGLSLTIVVLMIIVLCRVVTGRRLWLADVLACGLVSLLSPVDVSSLRTFLISAALILPLNYCIVSWQIRRFGLIPLFGAVALSQSRMPLVAGSWHAGRDLFTLLIPVAIAGWALWVIASNRRSAPASA